MKSFKTLALFLIVTFVLLALGTAGYASTWQESLAGLFGFEAPAPAAAEPPAAPMFVGEVTVVGSTGADGPYTTLKGAFDAINLNTNQTGNTITITITANTTETASAVLNQPSGGSWTSLTITPSTTATIFGSIAGPLVDLNGADNVTFSCANTLTIENTLSAATPSAIRFIGDATNNTVQNCTVKSAETSTTLGTIFFSTGTTTGNDGNIITGNTITSSGANFATNAIYSAGTSAAIDNGGIQITNNNISDYFNATSATAGINVAATGNSAWTITGNKLFQSATRTHTASATHNGITVLTGSAYTINTNTIGFANSSGTGTTNIVGNSVALTGFPGSYTTSGTANATRYIAINAAFSSGTVSNIQGNTIAGFALYTSSGASTTNGVWCGINVTSGSANIGTTSGNTIGASSGSGSIYTATTTTGGTAVGIFATSVNTVNIQNNTIGAVDAVGTTATLSGGFTGIDSAGAAGIFTINSNTIGNTTADNIRTGYTLSGANLSNAGTLTSTTGATAALVGIRNTATGTTLNINSNTFRGWATSGTVTAVTGIINTGAVTTTVTNNSNLLGTSGLGWIRYAVANSGALTGISKTTSTTAAVSINSNDFQGIVHSVAGSSTHTYLTWSNASSAAANINNNTFTNLNVNTTGSITFMTRAGSMSATGSESVSSNSIVTAFNKGGSGGTVTFFAANASSVTGSTMLENLNNFSNITVPGSTIIAGWNETEGSSSTSSATKTITNNTFNNIVANATPTGSITIMTSNFSGSGSVISNNTISNVTGGAAITGIALGSSNPTVGTMTVSGNTIDPITTSGAAAVTAISSASTNMTISKNKIYDLGGTNAGTTVNGILLTSPSTAGTNTVVNNIIGNLTASAATGSNAINGLNITSTLASQTYNVYYNTIYLNNPTSGAGFGSSGLFHTISTTSTTASLNLRNNIIVNTSVQNGAGLTVAYRRRGGAASNLANYAATSNNNDFYAGTPGAANLIYSDGTSSAQTITAYKNGVFTAGTIAPRDSASFSENPSFLSTTGSSANFLHINPATPSQIESGAVNISGITDDFDAQIRQGNAGYSGTGTAPDVGADEFNGTALDLTAPAITYTAFTNTTLTTNRTLSVTITDATGVATGSLGPRIYFKKSTDPNFTLASSTQCTMTGGTAQNGTYNCLIDYSLVGGGSVSIGNIIQYFVVAQDTATTPNIGANPSAGFAATDVNNVTSPPTTPNSYTIVAAFPSSPTVGTGGTYTSLTNTGGLFEAMNAGIFTGNTDITITSNLTGETGSVALNQLNEEGPGAGTFTVTIKPDAVRSITGTGTGGILIKLNGADRVTIDGSTSGGTDRSLTLSNPNTANGTGTLFIASLGTGAGATNDTIKNCIIKAGSIGTTANFTFGVFVGDTTGASAGADNDNLTIQNNQIMTARTGLQAVGTAAGVLDNLQITQNLIGDNTAANSIGRTGMTVQVLNNASITSNTVKNVFISGDTSSNVGIQIVQSTNSTVGLNTVTGISATGSSVVPQGITAVTSTTGLSINGNVVDGVSSSGSVGPQGITVSTGVTNSSVTRNNVTNISYTGTGGYGGKGIEINTGTASSNVTVANNFITNIKGDCWSPGANILDTVMGMRVIGTTGGVNIYNNSVNLGSGSFAGSTQSGTISAALYIASTATALNVRNNILSNNLDNTTIANDKNYAFYSDAANTAFTDINFNDYWVPISSATGPQVLGFIGSDRLTIGNIQTGTGKDAASISSDPLFATSTNLHIASGSPARNAGTTIAAVTNDFDGDTRPQEAVYDIGADEYVDAIAPETTIDSNPPNPSGSNSATFTFSGTDSIAPDAVASFECDLDGSGFSTCTSPQTYNSLSEGSHTFQVRAKDAGGNVDPSPASYTWVVDTLAPDTGILTSPSNPTNSNSATFTFNGSDSGTGVASFECNLDGGGFSTCTSGVNYPGLSDGSHTFQVRAKDGVGNTDASPAAFMWVVDTIAPDTSILTNPTDPSNSSSATFTFNGSDSGTGVSSFECDLDGGGFTTCTSGVNYPGLSDGSHTFQVRAKDGANNTDGSPASFTWVIDATAPDTSILTNPSDPTNSNSATFTFNGSDSGTGVSSFECDLDGGGFTTCTSGINYPGLSDGSHTFQVRAKDGVNNTDGSPASFTWVIDTVAPDTSILTNPSNPTNSNSATFTFNGSDSGTGVASFECSLDGGSFTSCTSGVNYPGLSDGSHTFDVRAKDFANNTDASPASFMWVIDTVAPDTSLSTTPSNPTNSTSATFTFTGSDSLASAKQGKQLVINLTFECSLDGSIFTSCTSGVTYSSLSDGSHTFDVRAKDAANNTDASPASFTWVIDATPPDTSITANPSDPTNSTSASFNFTGNDGTGVGVAGFECDLDGGGFASCSSPQSYPTLTAGSHTFQVRAKDTLNNTDASPASFTWTIDLTAPVINNYAPLPNTPSTAARVLTVNVTDNLAVASVTINYSINGGAYTPAACVVGAGPGNWDCTIPGQATGTAVAYYVSAVDTATNVAAPNPSAATPNLYSVGAATIPAGTYEYASLAPGSTLGGDITVLSTFDLGGIVDTGVNTVKLSCTAVVTGAGPSSYVVGNVRKDFCGTGTFSFPVGTTPNGSARNTEPGDENENTSELGTIGEYSPATVTINSGTFPSSLTMNVQDTWLPGLGHTNSLSRYWNVTEIGTLNANMTFQYLNEDVYGNELAYLVFKYTGSFTLAQPGTVNAAANTFTATNVTNFSGWGAGVLAPTAATASISGRVLTAGGRPIANVRVIISGGSLPESISMYTGQLGYYSFTDLPVGQDYVVTVKARRFHFTNPSHLITLNDNITDGDFIADPQE